MVDEVFARYMPKRINGVARLVFSQFCYKTKNNPRFFTSIQWNMFHLDKTQRGNYPAYFGFCRYLTDDL